MKSQEIRGKENTEILFDLEKAEKELFDMRFRSIMEQNADPSKVRRLRRDIARMLTILHERDLGVRGQEVR